MFESKIMYKFVGSCFAISIKRKKKLIKFLPDYFSLEIATKI